jgi:ATP-dependent DNA helicase DinG
LELGNWALIDIETTGIDPTYDQIIDLGYLQFEGTKLVKEFSSLVRTDVPLSQFIQKLTGIKQSMITKAPRWDKVEIDLLDLEGHYLLAHNAGFEEKFLHKYFDKNDVGEARESYQDSMFYLSLLFPERSKLNLESFMIDFGIAEKEEHRGLADSIALLQVLLMATYLTHQDMELKLFVKNQLSDFYPDEFWYRNFFNLSQEQLLEIAEQIDFDLKALSEAYIEKTFAQDFTQFQKEAEPQNLEFSGERIKQILSDENRIRKFVPNYSFRPAQETLALKAGQSFKNGIHSLIQAPTGTGKTIGYLIPSFLFAMEKKEPVLVSTGTKTLQNQAITKDIPQVYKLLGLTEDDVKVTRLIGSGNHLCELMFRNQDDPEMLKEMQPFSSKFVRSYFEMLFFYNQRVPHDKVITRDDLPYALKRMIPEFQEKEDEIKVDYRACTGHNCPYKEGCSYIRGLRQAKDSDIIIGNHTLTLTWPRSFARPEYIVMDEAHKLESEATRTFSLVVNQKDFENLGKNLPQQIGPLFYLLGNEEGMNNDDKVKKLRKESLQYAEMIKDHLVPLKDAIEKYFKKMPRYTDIYWNELPMIKKDSLNDSLAATIFNHCESMKYILENIYTMLVPYKDRWDANAISTDKNKVTALTAFEAFLGHLEDVFLAMETILNGDEKYSHSVKYHEDYGYVFEAAPIDVGDIIHKQLLEPSTSVVFTSATLANASGTQGVAGVEWMTGYSYLEPTKRFKHGVFLEDVYDYKNNAKVYVCTDVPSLYDQNYVKDVLKKVIPLITDLGGRTLLLFSARVRFERAVEILLDEFEGKIPLFIQGMGNSVVEDFKNSETGILIGMESFGEGIDIPGDSLQLVFVDKIPDLRQDLVIKDRRDFYQKQFGNEFNDYFLAHRTRSLHQKLGRLIRSKNDRGGIIITDSRIKNWKRGTLDTFKRLMEPYELQFAPLDEASEEINKFIQS